MHFSRGFQIFVETAVGNSPLFFGKNQAFGNQGTCSYETSDVDFEIRECAWQFCRIVWNVHMAWTTLSSFDEISQGLGNIIIILMQPPRAWETLSAFWCNVVMVQKTRHSFRPRKVVPAIDELSEPEHLNPRFWCPFLVIKQGFVPAWTK